MTARDLASLKDIAAAAAMDPRTAGRILRDAGLAERKGRRFPKAEALAVLARDADPVLLTGHATAARGAGVSLATNTLATARAASEEMRAKKLALDIAVREGRYLQKDRVEAAVADLIVRARNALLALGPRVAPKLKGITDPHQVAAIVEVEVRAILSQLGDPERLIAEVLE